MLKHQNNQFLLIDIYNTIQTESIKKINYKEKLPSIKNNNNSEYYLEKEIQVGILNFKICRHCLKNNTNYYCRKCDVFTCSKCSNRKHKNHLILEINSENEKLNIEKYKKELLNNFSSAINNLDSLDNLAIKEISEDNWKLKYNKAINKLTYITKIKLKKSQNNNNIEDNNENDNKEDLNNKLKEEKIKINNIVISGNKDPYILFKEINEKEKSVRQIIKQKNKENNKIDDYFCKIENEIDNIMYDLEENIFSK